MSRISVLKDLKETAEGLYRHLIKGDTKNEDLVAEKVTQDINQHFSGGHYPFPLTKIR